MVQVAAYALQILGALPQLLQAGRDVNSLVQTGTAALKVMQDEGREPSAQDWQELNDKIAALQAELHDTGPMEPAVFGAKKP